MNRTGIIASIACATLTGVGGFFVGQNSSQEKADHQDNRVASKSVSSVQHLSRGTRHSDQTAPNLRGYELSKNPRVGLKVLLEELRQSPLSNMDFESLFGIWDMIQYLDSSQLGSLVTELNEEGGGEAISTVRMMLLYSWATEDGPAAIESALKEEEMNSFSFGAVMGAMTGWMLSDPEQAYSWLQENGERLKENRFNMNSVQFEGMYYAGRAKTDFQGTMAELADMKTETQQAVIQSLVQSIGTDVERRDELMEHLKEKGDEALLKETRRNIISQLSWQAPEEALSFIKSEALDDETEQDLMRQTTFSWSQSDPKGALEYLGEELRGKENAGDTISSSFGNWIAQNEAEAAKWLNEQPDEFKTDSVFQQAGARLRSDNYLPRTLLPLKERKGIDAFTSLLLSKPAVNHRA